MQKLRQVLHCLFQLQHQYHYPLLFHIIDMLLVTDITHNHSKKKSILPKNPPNPPNWGAGLAEHIASNRDKIKMAALYI